MVMKQMRENTKWIMLVTALAFVGLMVFQWGMDVSGRSANAQGDLGQVDGDAITYVEFNEAYRTLYDQRQQQQNTPITSVQNKQLEDQAWNQIVMDRLLAHEMERRGITVTDREVQEAARYAPPPDFYNAEAFQTNGQFDLEKYHRFLGSGQADPQLLRDLESYYRRVIPRSKLFQEITGSVVVTDGELWRRYREEHETASVRYIALDPQALVPASAVTVDDGDIASYYNAHRSDFERPARAQVKVASISKTPTPADTAAALAHAREVRQEIENGGDFAQVASRESQDQGSAAQGGALGTIQKGQTVPPFDEAVWSAPVGKITEPVLSPFGYHLIRVDSRSADSAKVDHILIPIERTPDSEDSLLARVDSLESTVGRMTLESAAQELGLQLRTTELTPVLPTLPGVGDVSEGVNWVFDDAPPVGDVSPIFENQSRFYVMELVDRQDKRPLTLEEATPSIRGILLRQARHERTRDIGRQVVDRLTGGASLEDAAASVGAEARTAGPFTRDDYVPGIGSSNAVIGAAFGLETGQTSGLLETEQAFYVIQVTSRTAADRAAWQEQLPQQRQQVVSTIRSQRLDEFLSALRDNATVVDNREKVLNAADDAAA